MPFAVNDRVQVKEGWMLAGRTGTILSESDYEPGYWIMKLDGPVVGDGTWHVHPNQIENEVKANG